MEHLTSKLFLRRIGWKNKDSIPFNVEMRKGYKLYHSFIPEKNTPMEKVDIFRDQLAKLIEDENSQCEAFDKYCEENNIRTMFMVLNY